VWTSPSLYWLGAALTIIIMVTTMVAPPRMIPYFLILLLLGPDITQVDEQIQEVGKITVGSPWTVGFRPITPGILQAMVYLVSIVRLGATRALPSMKWLFLYAFSIGFIGFLVAQLTVIGFTVPYSTVIADIRFIAFVALASFVFHGYFRQYPEEIFRLLQLLLIIFIFRMAVDVLLWIMGLGALKSGVSTGGVDSTKWTVLIVAFWSFSNLVQNRTVVLSLALLTLSIATVFFAMTRLAFVEGFVGLFLLSILLGKVRLFLLGIPTALVALFIGLTIVQEVAPDAMHIYTVRFMRLGALLDMDCFRADPMRSMEYVNCFTSMARDGSIVTGRGFGGYYTDSVIWMGSDLTSAFPPWVEQTRHFPRIHSVFGRFVLKFGLIGLSLWMFIWWRTFIGLIRAKALLLTRRWDSVRILLIACMPAIFLSGYWSSKGMILTGLFLALANHVAQGRCALGRAQTQKRSRAIGVRPSPRRRRVPSPVCTSPEKL